MLGHVSWLVVPSVVQVPAASPTVSLDHTAPPAGQPVGSVILKSTVLETVLSAQWIPVYRMEPPATVTLPSAMMECARLMMTNAAFTLV